MRFINPLCTRIFRFVPWELKYFPHIMKNICGKAIRMTTFLPMRRSVVSGRCLTSRRCPDFYVKFGSIMEKAYRQSYSMKPRSLKRFRLFMNTESIVRIFYLQKYPSRTGMPCVTLPPISMTILTRRLHWIRLRELPVWVQQS